MVTDDKAGRQSREQKRKHYINAVNTYFYLLFDPQFVRTFNPQASFPVVDFRCLYEKRLLLKSILICSTNTSVSDRNMKTSKGESFSWIIEMLYFFQTEMWSDHGVISKTEDPKILNSSRQTAIKYLMYLIQTFTFSVNAFYFTALILC